MPRERRGRRKEDNHGLSGYPGAHPTATGVRWRDLRGTPAAVPLPGVVGVGWCLPPGRSCRPTPHPPVCRSSSDRLRGVAAVSSDLFRGGRTARTRVDVRGPDGTYRHGPLRPHSPGTIDVGHGRRAGRPAPPNDVAARQDALAVGQVVGGDARVGPRARAQVPGGPGRQGGLAEEVVGGLAPAARRAHAWRGRGPVEATAALPKSLPRA